MPEHTPTRPRFRIDRRAGLALAAAGLVAIGGATGAVVTAQSRPSVSMAPATPVPIRTLSSSSSEIVTVRGRVVEVFGKTFVVDDGTGRALVDGGPEGDDRQLVTANQPVTVQGRFDRGIVHAAFLVGPDKKVQALGPFAGPPRPPHGGPDRGPAAPPPPPPTDAAAVTSPPEAVAPAASGSAPAPAVNAAGAR